MNKEKRIWCLDYLRVFAIIAVMMIHISGDYWENVAATSFQWQTFNFFKSTSHWAVPVLLMISGALFLSRDIPIKKIYKKYVLRLVLAFMFWSFIYLLFADVSFKASIAIFIKGHYHMWYIPMIIAIYIIVPLLKPITEDDKRTLYFLILAFIFAALVPFTLSISRDFFGKTVNSIVEACNALVTKSNMRFVMGYVGYFVLGYYLYKTDLSKKTRMIIYILGIVGFIMTIALDSIVALKTLKQCNHYYSAFTPNILFEAMGLFTWFKYQKYDHKLMNKIILKLSKWSFGAYLAHALIIEILDKSFGLNTLSFNPILSVLSILAITAIVSFIISAIINHIPILKKYVV